ncbi:hypothetical protein BC628DRAFT_1313732 [Trametes gibbosa]|nr:hypothetical protein BC628DRAFT_1313732 [Trametes gibbosa]
MSGHLLPQALLDLTLARASARLENLAQRALRRNSGILGRRRVHQDVNTHEAPVTEHISHESGSGRSFYTRRDVSRDARSALATGNLFPRSQEEPISELERRIVELKEAPVSEQSEQTSEPSFSESDLVSMYEELLAIPPRIDTQDTVVADPESQHQADKNILAHVVQSLYELESPTSIPTDTRSQYVGVIAKLREIVDALQSTPSSSASLSEVSILAPHEWTSLVRVCLRENDAEAAENILDLMKRAEVIGLEEAVSTILALHADRGDIANTERLLAAYASQTPTDRQRHLHIKAHIRSLPPRTFPTTALQLLHDYEGRGLPAPMKTYTRAIQTLFHVRSAVAEAQAWDLFAHMRYVAHPTPDAFLYSIMIIACGPHFLGSQPARALDLWTEMTVDKGISPTAASYTAIISACARSGEKQYVNEAFRLAKQMLDGHRDAYGNPAFRPNQQTFTRLLEGAKRIGDLAKVRWILAEIISESLQATRGDLSTPIFVDDRIMNHVFHAYAAYKPPFNRAATVVVDKVPSSATAPSHLPSTVHSDPQDSEGLSPPDAQGEDASDAKARPQALDASQRSQFTRLPPQSRAEVLGETQSLFYRILKDTSPSVLAAETSFPDGPETSMPPAFQRVSMTARLLNAYFTVHWMHNTLDEAADLYRRLWSKLGVEKNAWTYVDSLERCARSSRGPERKTALKLAREVWQEWMPFESAWQNGLDHPEGMSARTVERVYAAMIRMLSLTGHLREAMQVVHTFAERYPPDAVKLTASKPELRSTRTVLDARRPLVRLMAPTDVPDDTVPPLLSFTEVEILHHRLVSVGDIESVRYLKWICMAYEGALKKRKEAILHARPESVTGAPIVEEGEVKDE